MSSKIKDGGTDRRFPPEFASRHVSPTAHSAALTRTTAGVIHLREAEQKCSLPFC